MVVSLFQLSTGTSRTHVWWLTDNNYHFVLITSINIHDFCFKMTSCILFHDLEITHWCHWLFHMIYVKSLLDPQINYSFNIALVVLLGSYWEQTLSQAMHLAKRPVIKHQESICVFTQAQNNLQFSNKRFEIFSKESISLWNKYGE